MDTELLNAFGKMLEETLDKKLEGKFDEKLAPINNRLTGLEDRLTGFDVRITNRLTEVEEQLTSVVDHLVRVEERLVDVRERMTGVEGRMEGVEGDLKSIKLTLETETNRDIQTVLERTDGFGARCKQIDSHDEQIEDIDVRVCALEYARKTANKKQKTG